MGRRPIGRTAMTKSEYQRRWRAKKKRLAAAGGNSGTRSENITKAIACYEAYTVFKDEMAAIAAIDYPSEQLRATALLGAVVTLLSHDLPVARSFHALYALLSDMYDLGFGGRPVFFFKATKPADVTKKVRFAHSAQGYLASVYAALVGPGRKKPVEAVKWLNGALKERKLAALVSGEDIQGWYHQVTAKRGKVAPMLVATFQELLPKLSNLSSPAEAKAFAIQCLNAIAIGRPSRVKLRVPATY
jgi:hypothetical protein